MLPTPTCYRLCSGSAEGKHELTALDGALLAAGVGDVNLLKVSSILPPRAVLDPDLRLPPGALVPIAYGALCSHIPGARIAAAVGVGIGRPDERGVIIEHALYGTREEAEWIVREMILEAFAKRGEPEPRQILVQGVEHTVQRLGCAFAGLVLWYGTGR